MYTVIAGFLEVGETLEEILPTNVVKSLKDRLDR